MYFLINQRAPTRNAITNTSIFKMFEKTFVRYIFYLRAIKL